MLNDPKKGEKDHKKEKDPESVELNQVSI